MNEFKKLSNDTIFKLVFSDEEIMIWFLERILKKKIKKVNIFNGQNGQPITEQSIIKLIKQELEKENINVKTKIVDLLVKINNETIMKSLTLNIIIHTMRILKKETLLIYQIYTLTH